MPLGILNRGSLQGLIGCEQEIPRKVLRRPVRRQPVVDMRPETLAQPQQCIGGHRAFAVMRVQASADRQASDRPAGRRRWPVRTSAPRTASLAACVTTSGSIRMPGVTHCRMVPATAFRKSGRSSHSRYRHTRDLDDDNFRRDHGQSLPQISCRQPRLLPRFICTYLRLSSGALF